MDRHTNCQTVNTDVFQPVFELLDKAVASGEKKYIAIDGRCGSGKTTLASMLAEKYPVTVFRMDDFFLPFELRTPERLATPGGNVHYERFIEEIKNPLLEGKPVQTRAFDCSTGEYKEVGSFKLEDIVIVEGSYSLHPEISDFYDVKIFLTVDPEEQKERLLKREGEKKLQQFINRWIPMEELYFSSYKIAKSVDFIINTSTIQ